nr:siderophore-interacting protein [Serratia fonticola]
MSRFKHRYLIAYAIKAGSLCPVVKTLRRYLIGERDLDRSTVNFMAYWC